MDYDTLSQLLQDYCENFGTEFVDNIPNIVKLAEDRIYQSVEFPALKKNATSSFVASNKYLNVPDDFLAPYSMAAISSDVYSFLLEREVGWINEAYPDPTETGIPKYYALFNDTTFIVAPVPDANYQVELHYFYEPESIVTASTTWLGDNMESVLFYGCLVEAYTYMKGDPDLLALYKSRYDDALANLKRLGEGKDKRDNFKIDAPRVIPT